LDRYTTSAGLGGAQKVVKKKKHASGSVSSIKISRTGNGSVKKAKKKKKVAEQAIAGL